ncbi:hypothetical protein MLD38_028756 [Melastoma candidum]|uniref:Uncharacterized protein n=1 Tax=Melastoma candidum TaxID=119954 RepID=A0ACB9N3R2_9MYRT|nr:hypothetical protein MLD38_028756 [Melastoma candidum]
MPSPSSTSPDPLPKPRKKSSSLGINPGHQQPVRCPRCLSSSTKFSYYNNYSLSQPRHFCKTCRRYWTKGGALRHIPVGGSSRKTKRLRPSSYSSYQDFPANIVDAPKLLHTVSSAHDFPLDRFEIPRVGAPNAPTGGIYNSQVHVQEGPNFTPLTMIPPKPPSAPSALAGLPDSGGPISMMTEYNPMSSVESLGRVNLDMHWKLQQQRLAAALHAVSMPRERSWCLSTSRLVPRQENIARRTEGSASAEGGGGGSRGENGLSVLEGQDRGGPWFERDVSA